MPTKIHLVDSKLIIVQQKNISRTLLFYYRIIDLLLGFFFELLTFSLRFSIMQTEKRRKFMLTKDELPECPVATTVQLIGNKWKLLILRNMFFSGKQRFTDFMKTIPGLSKKVLTDNLRALENDGLIEREVFAEVPPRVEYSLSDLGKTLKPVLDAMLEWGEDYKASL